MKQVEGKPSLYRDDNGAIINTDVNEFLNYQKKRDQVRKQQNEINALRVSINNLNKDMADIKQALQTLIEIIK